MKILLLVIGKTDEEYVFDGIEKYKNRLKHYINFEYEEIPDLKNRKTLSKGQQKKQESDLIFSRLKMGDKVVLLDEKGTSFGSVEFSKYLQKKMNSGIKRLVFIVGGPYGFDKAIYDKHQDKLSLSKMTFSHQMVRLIFKEQLYRAYTIIKGEKYHHK